MKYFKSTHIVETKNIPSTVNVSFKKQVIPTNETRVSKIKQK